MHAEKDSVKILHKLILEKNAKKKKYAKKQENRYYIQVEEYQDR